MSPWLGGDVVRRIFMRQLFFKLQYSHPWNDLEQGTHGYVVPKDSFVPC